MVEMEASFFFIPDRAFLAQASIKLTVWPKMTSCSLFHCARVTGGLSLAGLNVYFGAELVAVCVEGAMLIAFSL